jgi:hypothetical protein
MDTQENNLGKVKKTDYQGQNLGAVDAEKSSNFDDAYEASGDAVRANPSKDSDKDVELEKGPSFDREAQAKDSDQSLSQQEQQQSAGIPTQSSSTRKSHEGAGRSSSDTYSENTDRSDLDEEGIDVKGDDEVSEETIEESKLNRNNRGSAPHVSHG